jgi:hypothetical protein
MAIYGSSWSTVIVNKVDFSNRQLGNYKKIAKKELSQFATCFQKLYHHNNFAQHGSHWQHEGRSHTTNCLSNTSDPWHDMAIIIIIIIIIVIIIRTTVIYMSFSPMDCKGTLQSRWDIKCWNHNTQYMLKSRVVTVMEQVSLQISPETCQRWRRSVAWWQAV